jgi:3-hydroxyisobutyrate dehydrogenase
MNIGFIGLGNVGGKLAGSFLRNGYGLSVLDLNEDLMQSFINRGACRASSPKALAQTCDIVITCLPSPAICSQVMEADNGILAGLSEGKIWAEMSTTDESEVKRLAELVQAKGCHRAATGNISIFAGCDRNTFDRMLPILTTLGRRVLHTGPIGSASVLKVMTNYLATANLLTLCEAMVTMKAAGMDMATTYEAIKISSGTSFVAETEGQIILNGSRDISFTMDLVKKDIGLFHKIAESHKIPLDISPVMVDIFNDGIERYGERELSPNIIRRLEDVTGLSILADGFPNELMDDELEASGYEVVPRGH